MFKNLSLHSVSITEMEEFQDRNKRAVHALFLPSVKPTCLYRREELYSGILTTGDLLHE